ncbi:MAG: PilC/PilY family type IV pilus protein [Bermanella sp.]
MKNLNLLLALSFLSAPILADDTEIYGATAIDESNRVNSNVLFIMDTSGSMSGSVTVTTGGTAGQTGAYDNNHTYTGDYDDYGDYFYHDKSALPSDGHLKISLKISGNKYTCDNELATLNSVGKVVGKFDQKRGPKDWITLQDGNDNKIRCGHNNADSYTLTTSNYMNWYHGSSDTTSTTTRLQVVVDVVKHLTHTLSNINLGLMRFDRDGEGGMIDVPVTDIATSGELIRNKLDSYYHRGYTPLSETLHEAALYYRGENWRYGSDSTAAIINDNGQSEVISYPSASTSLVPSSSGQYKSPIESECQKNHIILLTDGEPYYDTSSNSDIKNYVADMSLPTQLSKSCGGSGGCLDELAYWLKNTDSSTTLTGNQDVTLYTIGGFNLSGGVDLLTRAANFGGGRYYPADDTQGLIDALDAIFLDILSTDSTFTAPAVSVNAFNASEHRDELFYALFRPADNIKWAGNLKKYKLLTDGMVVGTDTSFPAISEATGFFNESTSSYWNTLPEPDGKNVREGGMANKLTTTRNILTNQAETRNQVLTPYSSLTFNNDKVSFAISDEAIFNSVHTWSRGIDIRDENGNRVTNESRQSIGDPLHSEPVIVTYGGDEANPVASIFFGSNEGFIHSVDTNTGQEIFSFIPKELRTIQKSYFDNTIAAGNKPYGMDGLITSWFYDKNGNHVLLNDAGVKDDDEHIYLYAGMRRGGDSYYALDISHRTTPTLKFMIKGGQGEFAKLGQSWSKMTVAKVKYLGAPRFVLFFSGGYDTDQDGNDVRTDDDIGNAIYMVDAHTGERLWWASKEDANLNIPTMSNSMPASISAVDISGDGFINYLFAADTGGRVFRIDINQSHSAGDPIDDFAQGGEIASLAGADADNNRRFYNKPNVSLVKDKQYGDYLTIAIGSGYRAHPISTKNVNNRFYMIKDFNVQNVDANHTYQSKYEAATDDTQLASGQHANPLKLYNATALMNGGPSALTSSLQALMNGGGGWYVQMQYEGEKVLAESTTFSGAIIFTSFSPSETPSSSACGADTGASRTYALDQKWAMPSIDLDGDGDTDSDDGSVKLAHSGIAPRPVVIYRKGGGKTIAIGTETIDDSRFASVDPNDPCIAANTCSTTPPKCITDNCGVKPIYWREN